VTPGKRAFGLGLLFTTGCPGTPASAPQAQATAPAPRPAASAPLSSSGAGGNPSGLQGSAPAGGAASPAPESRTVKDWFCFSWVHGRDFASPCFPEAHACAQAFTKDAHQDKKPCSEYSGPVTCAAPGGHAASAPNTQRCFQ